MKTNKSLFEKKIDLKSCQINGGRLAEEATQKESSTATSTDNCSDTKYITKTDKGTVIKTCTDFNCP
ncbi:MULTISPECIES: hypothetical protein [unclassified Pedobacter]|uniref:hypothetical protein n=1 Tax=unclassified Pedobacter TaxID=2628915 RepID=UPI001E2DAEE1|nr:MULTISPECIES: hypothetical protein [unclassified Pedobacter]